MLILAKTSKRESELRKAAVPLSEGEVELPYPSSFKLRASLPANPAAPQY